jgi:hypothetical protein
MSGIGIFIFILAVIVIIVAPLVIIFKQNKGGAELPPPVPTQFAGTTISSATDQGVCPQCKAAVDASMFFCDKCGTKLK